MATLDDILGKSGGETTPPKGSAGRAEQKNGNSTPAELPKGSQEWAEQNSGDKMPPSAPAPSPTPPTKQTDTLEGGSPTPSPAGKTSYSLEELYKEINPYTPPTAEELEKEKKRQKREQIFNAIGDGISALSNLFFTSQYAPSMYPKGNNLTERSQVRYDKLMKDREEKNEKYYAGLFRARQADERKSEAEREWQRQLGIDDYNRRRDAAKDERDRKLFDLNVQLQGHKISAAEADARRKGVEAEYAEKLTQAKIDTEKARGKAQSASASASNARAKYYNNGGSGGGKAGEYPWYDSDGDKHYAHSYEAMRQNAIDNGTWNEESQSSTTEVKSGRGTTVRTSETTRPGKGHSSRPPEKKKSPTATTDNGNKKKSPTA